ncbi:hypothetical protein I8H84_05145 [Candidatus Saccharibacteria bacterium]|nr:hypothetical protein [Candidatus Saccharibacteria bacterium]MBH1973278.1 hypothetical protein [Candidatus Saccharibacteria bacterium]MBH1990481.1 hypothetical protein [Candidatus Saccharibacteria bacterium]
MQIDITIAIVECTTAVSCGVVAISDSTRHLAGTSSSVVQRPSRIVVFREVLRNVRIGLEPYLQG